MAPAPFPSNRNTTVTTQLNVGIEVFPNLLVGNDNDASDLLLALGDQPNDWFILHAAKLPYHKLFCGYTGRGAPKDSPEYYTARRGNRLALNLIDVENVEWMPPQIWDAAMAFISEGWTMNKRVLVHCNQGGSRAPAIALLWLAENTDEWRGIPFEEAEEKFREVYPFYAPAGGPREYIRRAWPVVQAI